MGAFLNGKGLPNSNLGQEAAISHANSLESPTSARRAIPPGAIESLWQAPDGAPIRRIDLAGNGERGSLLFLPGRGDSYEKYLEALVEWGAQGWRVTAADWRGQAGSGRLGLDLHTGHIDDFSHWIADLATFWSQWRAQTPPPHVIVGHSMGGHLVLRACAERAIAPDAVVLSAPMSGFVPIRIPVPVLQAVARLMCRIGDRRRPAWRWGEKPGQPPESRIELLTHDAERYADELWWREHRPELAMGPSSWAWIERAFASMRALERPGVLERIQTPVLIVATTADRLVSGAAAARAAKRLPKGELLMFGAEARHEILREADPVRSRAMAAITAFLDRVAPAVQLECA